MPRTYAQIYEHVRALTRQPSKTLNDGDLAVLLHEVKLDIDRHDLPSLETSKSYTGATLAAGLALTAYSNVKAVYDMNGMRLSVRAAEVLSPQTEQQSRRYEDLNAYYIIYNANLRLYNGTDEADYKLIGNELYSPVDYTDGTNDPILQRHERLLVAGLIYQAKMWYGSDEKELIIPLERYQQALQEASDQDYTYFRGRVS